MRTFRKSQELFKKVSKIIPLASQTFSKSYLQFIKGHAPLFVSHAKGAVIWDVDGHRYVDFINALLPVILGYQYPAVDEAIVKQLKKGIILSLPSPSEVELAELLIKHIPCAEMVRFGKNGSDATSGAVRLGRGAKTFWRYSGFGGSWKIHGERNANFRARRKTQVHGKS